MIKYSAKSERSRTARASHFIIVSTLEVFGSVAKRDSFECFKVTQYGGFNL